MRCQLIPDRDELKKLAQTTDPNDFMRDLAQFSSSSGSANRAVACRAAAECPPSAGR